MSDLIDTTEMYLRTIYELIEDGVVPMRARIAEQLAHSGPTVSQTVARMERDGLVVVSQDDRHLELTAQGQTTAVRVMRKHRLAERLLTDVIGLDLPYVHEEACRWEHVMSDRVERRLMEMLGSPDRSPYGNAIPGLEEIGGKVATSDPPGTNSLASAPAEPRAVILVRIGEGPQAIPGLLEDTHAIGLEPGAEVTIAAQAGGFVMRTSRGEIQFDEPSAQHVFVSPVGT